MPRQTSRPILPALLGLLTIAALLYYLTLNPTNPPDVAAAAAAPANPLTHLRVSLRQTSTSPPTLTARVTNTHPSTPLTLLTWDTPLDPLALRLGLATVTFGAANEPLAIPTVQIRRKLPPAADAVVVVEPAGGWAEQEFVLEEPVLDVGRIRGGGGRARVGLSGRWAKVWEGREMGMGEGEALSGEWEVGPVEVVV